jgi:GTP-sensing pleiotropic transcriptional regulator CodY
VPGIDRDNDSGEYTQTYSDSDFIDAIDEMGGMAGTSEISDFVGCTHRTAYTRLQAIEQEGSIHSRKVGNSIVWIHDE